MKVVATHIKLSAAESVLSFVFVSEENDFLLILVGKRSGGKKASLSY